MACRTCRDRKVRCDGGQPACQKCERAREECVYVPASKQTKAELAESLDMVQERLGKEITFDPCAVKLTHGHIANRLLAARAEAALASQSMLSNHRRSSSMVSSSVPFTDHLATSPTQTPLSPPSSDYAMIPRHLISGNTNLLWPNAMPFSTDPSTDPNLSFSFQPNDGTLGSVVGEAPLADASSSTGVFPVYSRAREQGCTHNSSSRREPCATPTRLPSRRDVREWNAAQQRSQYSNGESSDSATPNKSCALDHLTLFINAATSTSADISGIALTVADYCAWARKNPEQCRESMFEIFEARVREIAELVNNGVVVTLEGIAASQTDISGLSNMAKNLRAAMAKGVEEKAEYFQSTYDIQRSLDDQRGQAGTSRKLDSMLGP